MGKENIVFNTWNNDNFPVEIGMHFFLTELLMHFDITEQIVSSLLL